MTATADLILFAVQGALRLGLEARQAYVDATRDRALVLPLPDCDFTADLNTARTFFNQYPQEAATTPRLKALFEQLCHHGHLDSEEEQQFINYYREIRLLEASRWIEIKPTAEGTFLTREFVAAMVSVRQWAREGEGNVTALQRVAGTIIELAIDYFAHAPGALNTNTRQGKVLEAVLQSLDQLELADKPLSSLPERLATAAIEGMAASAAVFISEVDHRELAQRAAASLAQDVAARIKALRDAEGPNADKEDAVAAMAEMVFRSLLSSAGAAVAKDPRKYLGINDPGQQALVSKVGGAVLDMIQAQPPGHINDLFSRESVDVVVKAAVAVAGEYPQLVLGANNGQLGALLKAITHDLSAFPTLIDARNFPAITESILQRTAENLGTLWPAAGRRPESHLLLTATRMVMVILHDQLKDKALTLSAADGTRIIEAVITEVAANPAWLIKDAENADPALAIVLRSVVEVLASRTPVLNGVVARDVVIAAISAVALNQDLLKTLPNEGKVSVAALVELAVTALWDDADPATKWRTARPEVVVGVTATVLQQGARLKVDPAKLQLLKGAVDAYAKAMRDGAPWDLVEFAQLLDKALV